ncbi:collagen alpha-1(III) chain isoform X12 [Rhipicephalus sanguineus]|uniref:collagen alpha-1(III) chain isoform X11 n=1 Tax=Rhipicephalus sanguineus TaxID=34632 RepID=UPI0020C29A75|nr:collagen alpha-1(III) chain isoform X11 [Rhipicephalus sanguineus]XP_049267014.1 collagen alpha-1(III) chain isoform X12 [Rhipicephalus sanguineus]
MNTQFVSFGFYFIVLLLAMLAEKGTCPNSKRGPPLPRGGGVRSGNRRGRPPTRGIYPFAQNQPGLPQGLGRGALGPVPPGSPPGAAGPVITPPSSPVRLDTVVLGAASPGSPRGAAGPAITPSPPQLSPAAAGPSGPSSPLRLDTVVLGAASSPPQLSPATAGQSGPWSPQRLDTVVFGAASSPPQLSPATAGQSGSPPQSGAPYAMPGPSGASSHPTLERLRPGPGQPGSPGIPGEIVPGATQLWLASAFDRHFIPIGSVRLQGEQCTENTVCEEGTCCLQNTNSYRQCKPLAKRGEPCSPRGLTNVYLGHCPCDVYQGTCENGICT